MKTTRPTHRFVRTVKLGGTFVLNGQTLRIERAPRHKRRVKLVIESPK